jgi:hypothetical protein
MTVLGLFFIGDASLLSANILGSVKNILNAILKYQTENEHYFLDTHQNTKYVLHYVEDNKSVVIFTLWTFRIVLSLFLCFHLRLFCSATCKRFSPSQGGNQFDNAEFTFSSNSWHRVTCYYDFEHLLPLYLETISNAILQDKFTVSWESDEIIDFTFRKS